MLNHGSLRLGLSTNPGTTPKARSSSSFPASNYPICLPGLSQGLALPRRQGSSLDAGIHALQKLRSQAGIGSTPPAASEGVC